MAKTAIGRAQAAALSLCLFAADIPMHAAQAACTGSLVIRLQLGGVHAGPIGAGPDCVSGTPDALGLIYWTYSPIRGQVGNGGLTATLAHGARTIGLFWPSPILYDHTGGQLNYETQPNAPERARSPASGLRYGVRVEGRFVWLDDARLVQRTRYAGMRSLRLIQNTEIADLNLAVQVESFVDPASDVLVQILRVTDRSGTERQVELVHYENLTPTELALPFVTSSVSDTALEQPAETVRVDAQALEHGALGVPATFALGADPLPSRRMAGVDTTALSDGASVTVNGQTLRVGPVPLALPDAYTAATEGRWLPVTTVVGPANAAQVWDLSLAPHGTAEVRLVLAAAPSPESARRSLTQALSKTADAQRVAADAHWLSWTSRVRRTPDFAAMPEQSRERLEGLFWRSLLVLGMNLDRNTGLLSAGAFRQPPYGASWPRDTSVTADIIGRLGYINEARRALMGTAALQKPDGGFGGNNYNNGTPWPFNEGLPLTYFGGQVDGTGWFVWAVARHHEQTGDLDFLRTLWPNVRKAADFMTAWRDPANGGHLASNEEDRFLPGQTIAGDVAVTLGLRAAAEIATRLGDTADARWRQRADEIEASIVPNYWREDPGYFAWLTTPVLGGEYRFEQDPTFDPIMWDHSNLMWPGRLFAPPSEHAAKTARHMDFFWRRMWEGTPGDKLVTEPYNTGLGWFATSLADLQDQGLLADGRSRARIVMQWLAKNAAPETHVIGEVTTLDRDYPQSYGAPHSWAHAFAIQGMLAAWPDSPQDRTVTERYSLGGGSMDRALLFGLFVASLLLRRFRSTSFRMPS